MTDTLVTTEVAAPGIYANIPEDQYHADPVRGGSFSCSGAKKLLDCPAKFDYIRRTGPEQKKEFDFGHAVHTHLLGTGAPVDVHDFDDWKTKAAREAKGDSYEMGHTPVLRKQWVVVEAMVAEVRRHPIASRLLNPDHGKPEQSLFWRDPLTGVMLRMRADFLPDYIEGRPYVASDYKTCASAEPRAFARAVINFSYHQQDPWYLDGIRAVLGVPDPKFVFIAQEKTAPYLVQVFQLDETLRAMGAERNRRAIDLFIQYSAAGVWPGYSDKIELITPPKWSVYQHDEDYGGGDNDAF